MPASPIFPLLKGQKSKLNLLDSQKHPVFAKKDFKCQTPNHETLHKKI